jgi:hypothetical protein
MPDATHMLPPRPRSLPPSGECGGGSCPYSWTLPDAHEVAYPRNAKDAQGRPVSAADPDPRCVPATNPACPYAATPWIDAFSSACWYTAQELTDILYTPKDANDTVRPVPIGLIEDAVGGAQIQGWASNHTVSAGCTNQAGAPVAASWCGGTGALFNGMVLPAMGDAVIQTAHLVFHWFSLHKV